MRSSKEELVKKDVLMPDGSDKDQDSKINVFLFSSGLDEKGKKEYVPLRIAYSQVGQLWHPAKRSLRAQAQLSETVTETFELVKVEPKL
ncbi:hypothetical protein TNCV_3168491 [Trichonephila clavipes]|nr:hypothetical protein TNCV_3168491 [Trichonephila clavipes]